MKIGISHDPIPVADWPDLPVDYLEANVQKLLMPEASDADFAEQARRVSRLVGRIYAANCFLPGDLKVVGPSTDLPRLARYAESAFSRARSLGIEVIVFGSGAARRAPEGWPLATAFLQLIQALEICAPIAGRHGVTLVLEPLNRAECNVVNTVLEGAVAVSRVNHSRVRLLVDLFHMLRNDEAPEDLAKVAPWIAHAHVAEKTARSAPGVAGDDFRAFFSALRHGGYDGTLSTECDLGTDPREQARRSADYLRAQWADAR